MPNQTKALLVRHTVTWQDAPLLTIENLPGCYADLLPGQARSLAQALLKAADDCDSLHIHTRRHGPARMEYPL